VINNHQDWQEQIPFYVAQSLSAEQRRSFEIHLATCEACQAEIDEWRMIASAVWREADDAARKLPPLSQEVYNRLSYRDKPPVSRYAANPPRPSAPPAATTAPTVPNPKNVTLLPKRPSIQLPITMVAGLVMAVIFGGLLFAFAIRNPGQGTEVALDDRTPDSDLTDEYGVQAEISPSPTDYGIIPPIEESLTPSGGTGDFETNTPEPLPPTLTPSTEPISQTGLQQDTRVFAPASTPVPPTPTPTATYTPEPIAVLGGGPYVTITPGAGYCEIYNPTNQMIEAYAEPVANAEITGALLPNETERVLAMSDQGWYSITLPGVTVAWIAPGMAYLRGACYAGYDIPFATPFMTDVPSPTFDASDSYESSSGRIVVINAAYADLQAEANFTSNVIGVVSRNQQFPVLGYQGVGTNRFVNILLPDGSSAWVWAQVVIDYAADQAPASPTPQ
jgi:hypothetical protein